MARLKGSKNSCSRKDKGKPKSRKLNEFEIISDKIVKIILPKGLFGYCDIEDWEYLRLFTWTASEHKHTKYLQTNILVNGKRKTFRMHLMIMAPEKGFEINHKDFDGLNCCKSNLQYCRHFENNSFKKKYRTNKSGYKGVSWSKKENKWIAQITVKYKPIRIGAFDDKIDAAKAYNEAALKYHGDFAFVNSF